MRYWFLLAATFVLLPVAALAVDVTLDQDVYTVGEVIAITFDNPTDDTAEFPSEPPFAIHRLDGEYEFPASLPVIVQLPPGETMVRYWDTGALPDPEGLYEVVVTWWYQANPEEHFTITLPYTLEGAIGVEQVSWSVVRRLFR